jgi:acyl-CoA synthetase (AMP-forming)/AMP-acid ligase II
MANIPDFLVAAWAIQRVGMRHVPVNRHLGPDEVEYVLRDSGAAALIANRDTARVAAAVASQLDLRIALVADDAAPGLVHLPDALADLPAGPLTDAVEGEWMFYSSGTTGRPKAAIREPGAGRLTLRRFAAEARTLYGMSTRSVFLSPAPLYHAMPLGWTMVSLHLGAPVVVMRSFDAQRTLDSIERYRVTHAGFVPTHFIRMLKLPLEVRSRYDVSSLQNVVHAAAPCPIWAKQQMIDWWGPVLYEYYSASEGGGRTGIDSTDWLVHKGSVGRPQPGHGRVRIVGPDGVELPPGQTGRIFFDGGVDFIYHGDPDKTANAHHPRGWVSVGDSGYLDNEGYLYLADRDDFMIISGGVNIYPRETEDVLSGHPAVADVAVVGIPHSEMGQEVAAYVALTDSVPASQEMADELRAYARSQLAHFKCPRRIEFVPDIPRTQSGKLLKRALPIASS